jgi:hypothetical protein
MSVEKPKSPVGEDGGPRPDAGAVQDAMIVERASATPIAPIAPIAPSTRQPQDKPAIEPVEETSLDHDLRDLQRWFAHGVMDRKRIENADIDTVLTQGPRLSASERLEIYRYAYRARLVECLADDYPVLAKSIGDAAFEALAKAYIDAHPSRGPNLNRYGRHFAASLEDPFAADLARLEWAMVEVLHAPASPPFPVERLEAIPLDERRKMRLEKSTTLRFLEFGHPVNRHLNRVKNGEAPAIPARAWSATAVYRAGYTIWRMDFTPAMADVLKALLEGRTLEDALATLEEAPVVEGDVMAWFKAWIEGGFFCDFSIAD